MQIMIVGAAGMIGRKLTQRLLAGPAVPGLHPGQLVLVDLTAPAIPAASGWSVSAIEADLSLPGAAESLIARRPNLIFHLAAIVSGEAEADFAKGYAVNLDGTHALFAAIHAEKARGPYLPRVVFSSSTGVFGPPFPTAINDEFFTTPLTSYGTQKAICELLLADYSRRGIFDGIGIRLPTICIRPGKPNAAVSGFFSNILREPLIGREAVLPVADEVRHFFASPRSAVGFLLRAATLDLNLLAARRNLNMPGLSATVGEAVAALRTVAGNAVAALIRREPDAAVIRMVDSWPRNFEPKRAAALGFRAETSFVEIIRAHIDDELGGNIGA